ncbi:FIG01129959: hypothetical protein [Streptomyces venezuelae]|nr:FIG01129959: hypothetical protein [Streptomyces venezuelae]
MTTPETRARLTPLHQNLATPAPAPLDSQIIIPITSEGELAVSYPELLTPEEKLTQAKEGLAIPEIVVICGSTRFMQEMAEADRELTFAGNIVVKPGCDMKTPHLLWADPIEAEAGKARLDDLHRAKIRLADRVLVVGDYIGDSTRAEIAYAHSLGKPVEFTHPDVAPAA